ncbi:MAG TPA: DUF397 domain-containing protein [Streptosporangiaceae bacterium]|nr:DUF397 domain-containing protein [Streptosporangiaceae bacterium]
MTQVRPGHHREPGAKCCHRGSAAPKDPDGPRLAFTAGDWRAFLRQVKDGQFA